MRLLLVTHGSKALLAALLALAGPRHPAQDEAIARADGRRTGLAIGQLPDFTGTLAARYPGPEAAGAGPRCAAVEAEIQQAGRPLVRRGRGRAAKGLLVNCLPHGMPTLMLITHNALEFLVTPGRVTVLGESEGNRLRRIHTDGRAMPEDPDPASTAMRSGAGRMAR